MPYVFDETQQGEPRSAQAFPALNSEVLTETFAQAYEENPVTSLLRANDLRKDYQTGTKLSAETARAKLKDSGLDGHLKVSDAGITQAALDTLMERKRTELKRQEVFQQAEGGFAQGAAKLGIGIGTSLIDPLNVASAFIPVVGEARYAKLLAGAGGLAGRTAVRAGVGAAEGAVGAALVEPIIYGSRRYEQADYTMADSLLNVAFGGLFGAGLHATFGAVGDGLRAYRGESRALPPIVETGERARVEPTIDGVRAGEPAVLDADRIRDPVAEPGTAAARVAEASPIVRENALKQAVVNAVEGEPIRVDHMIDAGDTVTGYTTAKGSTYEVAPDGTTTRDKAARPEHPGDEGPQPRSERTFYVTPEDSVKLGEFQTIGGPVKSVNPVADGQIGVRYEEGPHAGRFEKRTVVETQKEPAVGLIPVETWKDGQRVHFGNQITEVRTAPKSAPPDQAITPDPEFANLASHAEEVLARETDTGTPTADTLKMATEEAELATSDLQSLANRLGMEAEDADVKAVNEAVAMSARWAKTAELATACLMRGG